MKLRPDILFSLIDGANYAADKEDLYGKCPYCGHCEWSISVVKDNHLWECYRKKACGETGNVFKLLKKLNRLDLLINNGQETIKYDQRLENIIENKIEQNIDLNVPTISLPYGFKRIKSNYYLENRDFDSFEKYEVGMTDMVQKLKNHVIIVVKDNNENKGYIARLALNKKEHKELEEKLGKKISRYQNSTETDFSKLLIGYDEINGNTTTVILVEGMFGKEAVDRHLELDLQDEIKCCSTSGAKLSVEQIFKLQLKGIRHIILFFDIDVINKIKKHSMDLLNEFEKVEIVVSHDPEKDPADMTKDELFEVFSNPKDPVNFYLNHVHIRKLE